MREKKREINRGEREVDGWRQGRKKQKNKKKKTRNYTRCLHLQLRPSRSLVNRSKHILPPLNLLVPRLLPDPWETCSHQDLGSLRFGI